MGRLGGADAPDRFARFVERAVAHLGDLIGWACTINEPNVVAVMGYFQGQYPPGIREDFTRYAAVNEAMVRAHRLAVDVLRWGPANSRSGSRSPWRRSPPAEGGEPLRDAAEEMLEDIFLRATGADDFVGVQCYTRMHFGPDGLAPNDPDVPLTQMGDERWPQAVEHRRRAAAVSGRPVVVTENGIATVDDTDRIAFVSDALRSVHRCRGGHRSAGVLRVAAVGHRAGTWAMAPSSGWWRWLRGPSSAGPNRAPTGSERLPGPTGCSQRVPWRPTGDYPTARIR